MNSTFEIYKLFASVFTYPNEEVRSKIDELHNLLDKSYPDVSEVMNDFFEFTKTVSKWKWEELFTRTFDVQAITTLDIGYVLFGDDYKRGELLVNLNKEHQEAGNDCGNELADNLANLLRLIPRMQNAEIRNELVEIIIIPALDKILSEFNAESVSMKNKIYKRQHKTIIDQSEDYGRIYLKPLTAINEILKKDFNYIKPNNDLSSNSFTKSIKTEIEID